MALPLRAGEKVLLSTRRHWMAIFGNPFWWTFHVLTIGLTLLLSYINWRGTWFTVTDQRILITGPSGAFDLPIRNILNVGCLGGRSYGTVTIQHGSVHQWYSYIPRARKVQVLISDLVEETARPSAQTSRPTPLPM